MKFNLPTNRILRFLFGTPVFGGVSPAAGIPADAKPISEKDDQTEADMSPGEEDDPAGGGSKDGASAEGSETDVSQDGGDGEGEEPADASSRGPSGTADTGRAATEVDEGVVKASAAAVSAAVEAVLASPDTEAGGRISVKFKPTITKEMLSSYQKKVDAGDEAEGLADLIGSVLSEALEVYDEKRVLPVETTVKEARRNAANDRRIAEWSRTNAEDASNPDLWKRMVEIYNEKVAKYGASRADRISMEQLSIMAKGDLPASKRGKAKAAPAAEAETQKAEALGSTRTPGSIGTIRGKANTPKKAAVGHAGDGYREHLKSGDRNLW